MSQIIRDVAYGPHPLQQFDLHFPENGDHYAPSLVLIHGGGFIMGRKEDFEYQARLFSHLGFFVINISHRLIDASWFARSGQATGNGVVISDQLADVDDAVRLFKKKAAGWEIATNRLYIAGHSAGAILGMLYLLQDGQGEGIRAAGNWAGVTDLTLPMEAFGGFLQPWQRGHVQKMYDQMLDYSPLAGGRGDVSLISPHWVANRLGGRPVISIYPEKNSVLNFPGESALGLMQTKRFHALLRSQGVAEQFSLYRDCDHSFRGGVGDAWEQCVRETAAFFLRH